MTGADVRAQAAALSHSDLVAALVRLCSGAYPRAARDSVIAEMTRRAPAPPPVLPGQGSLFDDDLDEAS